MLQVSSSRGCRVLVVASALLVPLSAAAQSGTRIAVTPSRASGALQAARAEPIVGAPQSAQIKITTAHPELVKVDAVNPVQERPKVKVTSEAATVDVNFHVEGAFDEYWKKIKH